ncbi:MAG: L-aspartate oxidase [Deltaproteobacteria bacterium]|nr:L-aspartate oxidase [Deltaproteobacteria bacterium]
MQFETDFLIIGSGIAGLSFALKAATLGRVTMVTKKNKVDSSTNRAQGGIACVLDKNDTFADHIRDTLISGAGICDEEVVRMVVENGPECVRELLRIGVHFEQDNNGQLDLGREGGHSTRRIAHAYDLTGHEIECTLLTAASGHPNINILENHIAIDLLLASKSDTAGSEASHRDSCHGAYVLDSQTGEIHSYAAKVTILCSGGTGKVYLYTTNPDIATGDGIAMAYRAGARIANLEFVQFHPTCLYHPKAKNFLISEAVRGEGGRLIDENGRLFMQKYDPRGDLATRDMVARAIDTEMKTSGNDSVFLDITHQPADFIKKRFPHIYKTCLSYGIDMTREPIPVVPAAHYMCGGILTDMAGRSSIESLYALGETACTGLHGGNRLASNSLLEAVVYAEQAFQQCKKDWPELARKNPPSSPSWSSGRAERIEECILITHNWDQIRRLMWDYVGIVRSTQRLHLVQETLAPIQQQIRQHYRDYLLTPDLVELRNIALLADLIVRSALARHESRGLHYIIDYPNQVAEPLQKFTTLQKPPTPAHH